MNPNVTATVSVHDNASPKLREIADLAKRIGKAAADELPGGMNKYTQSLNSANRAAEQHLGMLGRMKSQYSAIAGIVGGIAATSVARGAINAVKNYIPYERNVRYQQAIQHFSPGDMALLEQQRLEAATKFGLKPEDTLEAQQALVTRNYGADITKAGTDQAIILSKALNTAVKDAATTLEGIVFGQGKDLKSPEDAKREFTRAGDLAAIASKKGAMTQEDIAEFAKFGLGTASAAGIKPETAFAFGMALKRANVPGSESGVFMRQLGARELAPTRPGLAALEAGGIHYEDYAKNGPLNAEGLGNALKRGFGVISKVSIDDIRNRLESDPEIMKDQASFTAAVVEEIGKHEKLKKVDQAKISRIAGEQYQLTREGLDGDRLANDIVKKLTAVQIQKFIGDRQAGRANMLIAHRDQVGEYETDLRDSSGFAAGIAKDRMEGLAFASDRLASSFDALEKTFVKANEGWLAKTVNFGADVEAWGVNLSSANKEVITAVTAYAGLRTALWATTESLKVITGLTALATRGGAAAGAVEGAAAGALVRGGAASIAAAAMATVDIAVLVAAAGYVAVQIGGYLGDKIFDGKTPEQKKQYEEDSAKNKARVVEDFTQASNWQTAMARNKAWADHPEWMEMSKGRGMPGNGPVLENGNPVSLNGENHSTVTGTVEGTAKIESSISITVEPTDYFKATVRRLENSAHVDLNGRLGTTITGSNATVPSAGSPVLGGQ
jgi:hypothetical protein